MTRTARFQIDRRSARAVLFLTGAALAIGSGSALMAQQAAAPAAAEQAIPALDRAQIDALLATPDKALFVDVRRPDEIAAIGGFPTFISIQASELDRFLAALPRDRAIVPVSNHAGRAKKAAALLVSKGFKVAGVVGAQDYEAQGGVLSGKKLVTAAIPDVVASDTRIEVLREGFEGTEGPVALQDGSILFTENRADRIVRIGTDGAITPYLEKTGGANALAVGANGTLLAVQTTTPGVAALQPAAKVLAGAYKGKPFNRPNDLAAARAGDIYFTDPGAAPQPGAAPVKTGVYWLDRKGKVTLVADDIRRPNGIALSPDEKTLYVANTQGEHLIAFTVKPDGSLTGRRDFATLAGFAQGANGPSSGADGVAVDKDGRVYVATSAGVQIFSTAGEPVGVIKLPRSPQNLAFGGKERSQLYVVGRGSVYRIATLTRGVDRPGK